MPSPPTDPQPHEQPGKTRTWWHPLLASLLRWQLGSHYRLEEEVPVGRKPLQIDLLLLRREQGELPARARQVLAGLAEYFNELTLVEFKSPSDTLRAGDFQTFLAYAFLYRAQNQPLLDPDKLNLLVIAPRLTRPYRDELRTLGVTPQPHEPGIWRLEGGVIVHRAWVLETEGLAGRDHPLLTLFSPQLLQDHVGTYDMMRQGGYTEMVVYVAQQILQFRKGGKEFAMQHLGAEDEMVQALKDIYEQLSPEDQRLIFPPEKLLKWLSPEEILKAVPPEDLLKAVPPEKRLEGLSPEELERVRRLLNRPGTANGGSSSPK
jgi:hypothetical protein